MEPFLAVITALSLILAVALGAALWHVRRAERARSEARVALLRAAAGVTPDIRAAEATVEQGVDSEEAPALFAHAASASAPPVNMAVLATAALAAAVAIVVVLQLLGAWTGPSAGAVAAEHRPLELLTLEHVPDRDGLTISGVARNPAGSRRLTGVVVTASALDADGLEIGSGRAAVDDAAFEPGTASAFVIKVAVVGNPSRYRVGFRGPDGVVIAHVDRRSADGPRDSTPGGGPWVH
jgi:hypothetical protein